MKDETLKATLNTWWMLSSEKIWMYYSVFKCQLWETIWSSQSSQKNIVLQTYSITPEEQGQMSNLYISTNKWKYLIGSTSRVNLSG